MTTAFGILHAERIRGSLLLRLLCARRSQPEHASTHGRRVGSGMTRDNDGGVEAFGSDVVPFFLETGIVPPS